MENHLKRLREVMARDGIDAYLIPSEDYHQSEYVGEYFKARPFISGFTGSAGEVVVTADEACLWTDGRYFIQAAQQLAGTEFVLQRMGEPGVPTVMAYLDEHVKDGGVLGVDGRTVSLERGESLATLMIRKGGRLIYDRDLVDEVWEDRPPMSKEPAFALPVAFSGESTASKVGRIREKMAERNADLLVMGALDDIAWTLNFRGNDVMYSPLVLSYLVIGKEEVHLFIDEEKLTDDVREGFAGIDLKVHPYDAIYAYVGGIPENCAVWIDPMKVNYSLYKSIPETAQLIEEANPSTLMKAVKNDVELAHFREAHIKDAVAWVKFMRWLKDRVGKETITEIDASDKLEAFRKEQGDYLWPSFAPISGYGEHAAIVHYSATEESAIPLEPKGLYLSDTGGNYMQGSTDITRTVALGPTTEEERFHFTLVLKSHIDLALGVFLEGTSGYALDLLARKPFWDRGLNYNHGTGHGIGYLLNVHEGPSGFRYRIIHEKSETHPFMPGMLVTNEPGIYIEGSHGIRTENVMEVVVKEKTAYGTFLAFNQLTLVPIDLDAVKPSLLTEEEIAYLNAYHKRVYDTISPLLSEEEREWLAIYTRDI